MSRKKLCSRCGRVIELGENRCEKCRLRSELRRKKNQKKYNKTYNKFKRDKSRQSFYDSKEWKIARNATKVRDKNICLWCYSQGQIVYADVVHHIVELSENINIALDSDNLICLCHACHNDVHEEYQGNDKIKRQNFLRNLVIQGVSKK